MSTFLREEMFRQIVDAFEVGVYIVDRDRKILYWNRGAEQITGYLAQQVVGRLCRDNILVHCNDRNPCLCTEECPLTEAMRDGAPRSGRVYLRHHAGHRVPVHIQAIPLRDENGAVGGAVEVFEEGFAAPDHRQPDPAAGAGESPHAQTGIASHDLTESYLGQLWQLFEAQQIPFGVLVMRADQLGSFRAQHGYEAAVEMLAAIGRTLRHSARGGDFLGHWREDRFLVLIPHAAKVPLESVAERLRRVANCASIPWWGDLLSIRVSAAVVKLSVGESLESLRTRIDACLSDPPEPNPAGEGSGA